MAAPLVTLDSKGVVTDPYQKIQLLLSYIVVNQQSQSTIFNSSIISISDIIRKYGQNKHMLKNTLETSLKTLFSRYFDNVEIVVNIKDATTDNKESYTLAISGQVGQDGKTYDVANSLAIANNKISLVTELH